MTASTLEALLRRISRAAEQCFAKHGEIEPNPMWLLENADGKQWLLETPLVADTELEAFALDEKLTADLQRKFREWSVCRYASATESWKPPTMTDEAYTAMGDTLKNAPTSTECIILQAGDDRQALCAFREIYRPPGGKAHLGRLEMASDAVISPLGALLQPGKAEP
jgi:hypothetical protein